MHQITCRPTTSQRLKLSSGEGKSYFVECQTFSLGKDLQNPSLVGQLGIVRENKQQYEKSIMLKNSSQPTDLRNEEVTIEYGNSQPSEIVTAYVIRLYPQRLNECDAYVEIQFNLQGAKFVKDIATVISSRLKRRWKVIGTPQKSPIAGLTKDGEYAVGIAPSWRIGLQET